MRIEPTERKTKIWRRPLHQLARSCRRREKGEGTRTELCHHVAEDDARLDREALDLLVLLTEGATPFVVPNVAVEVETEKEGLVLGRGVGVRGGQSHGVFGVEVVL